MNHINAKIGVAGEYRIVINEGTPQERDYGWFPNIITNIGLEEIGSGDGSASYLTDALRYCRIGTGTATPAITDVSLVNQVAASGSRAGTSGINEGSPNYSYLETTYYTFAQGAVVGNMTEVGVGWATTGATLFSRALILDGGGSPTTITLLAIDQLTVYYRLRWYPPLGDTSGNLTLSGIDYPYTMRLANAATWVLGGGSGSGIPSYSSSDGNLFRLYFCSFYNSTAVIGAITGLPTSYNSNISSGSGVTTNAYVPGSLIRTSVCTFNPSLGNASGGIGAFSFNFRNYMEFQMAFSTPIPKDNTKTLSFTVSLGWARH